MGCYDSEAACAVHMEPPGHSWQSAEEFKPVAGLKVPRGHSVGMAVPAGQYAPAGHSPPVTLSRGAATFAPREQ